MIDFDQWKDCYVKIVVAHKQNPYLFDNVIDNLYKAGVSDLNIVEDFSDVLVEDDKEIVDQAEDSRERLSQLERLQRQKILHLIQRPLESLL